MSGLTAAILGGLILWFIITAGRQLALHRSLGEESYARIVFDSAVALAVFVPMALVLHRLAYVYGGLALILGDVITLYPRNRNRH